MRIGLVVDTLDPRRGGVEQWTTQFVAHLAAAGHETHVVARGFAPETARAGMIPHTVDCGKSRLAFAHAAEEVLRGLRLDVVHDTGCGWHCDVFQPHGGARRASFEQNLRLAPRWMRPMKRSLAPWLPRYRELERLAARQYGAADRLHVAISRMVAGDLQRHCGVRPEQIRLVYNGVDVERFSPQQRDVYRDEFRKRLKVGHDEILLLIVAHNFRLKGVPTLIRSVGQLRATQQPVRLVIAGGKRTALYQRLAERVGAAEAVTFLGSVDDPVPLYAAADVYVQPTLYDPCSLVVLEALAMGLPVVTSQFNGAGELITPGREGAIVNDPSNADELTEVLCPFLQGNTRNRASLAARELATAHSWQRNFREMLAVYGEAAKQRSLAA